jgi:adenosine 3'-phospho 5'-phosphosulfate transporter B3
MIVGIIILKKIYSFLDYLAAVLFCLGLILFTLADRAVSPSYHPYGLALISFALVADALIGNLQEKAFLQYRPSAAESLFFSKTIGCCYLLIIVILTNQLISGLDYCASDPYRMFPILLFSISGWFGENFVMLMVKRFGAVATTTTTSARKAVTIIFSFILFPKPFSHVYTLGFFMIFSAIGVGLYQKIHSARKGHQVTPITTLPV